MRQYRPRGLKNSLFILSRKVFVLHDADISEMVRGEGGK